MLKMVQDLTREQLDELKNAFFWQDETQDILEGAFTSPEEIPDDIIFEHYDGVCFVDDDFFFFAPLKMVILRIAERHIKTYNRRFYNEH